MAFLEVKDIRKSFPGVVALDHVELEIELGYVHVFAGENGAGKSTLIRTLTGVTTPDSGSIVIDGRDALEHQEQFGLIAYVPQELNLFAHMSVAENLFMPFHKSGFAGTFLSQSALNKAAQVYLDRFNIRAHPGQRAGSIAVSDQQLLQIARASTNKAFKVLILDEPTSSLTTNETERLFRVVRQLRDSGHAVVFVSHKMEEIFEIGDTVTVLRNGRTVGRRMMKDITERELIRMMSGDDVKLDQTFRPQAPIGEPIVIVERLSGHRFYDVSFSLKRGEILGFAGLVGAGRTEVMQTLFGYLKATAGRVVVEGKTWKLGEPSYSVANGMIYLSEERRLHGILPMLSVRENIGITMLEKIAPAGVVSSFKENRVVGDVIGRYAIKTPTPEKKIMFLSGGNQQKVIIGRAMARQPKILIFDEPTKGIDIKTKVEIYRIMKQLADEGVGIILVSSEMAELKRCATRVITMYHGAVTGTFESEGTDANTLVAAIIGSGGEPDVA